MAGRDLKSLGAALVAIRERLGLTQEELAAEAGMSLKTVQRIELGRATPRAATLNLIDQIAQRTFPDWEFGTARRIMDGHAEAPAAASAVPVLANDVSAARRRIIEMSHEQIAERIAEVAEVQGPKAAGELLKSLLAIREEARQRT